MISFECVNYIVNMSIQTFSMEVHDAGIVSIALCLSSGGGILAIISCVSIDISVCSRDSVIFRPGDLSLPVYGLNRFFFFLSSSYQHNLFE